MFKSLTSILPPLAFCFTLFFIFSSFASAQNTSFGGSLQFDGSDDIVKTLDFPLATTFTVEAFIKRTEDKDEYETFIADTNRDYTQGMINLFIDGAELDCGTSPSNQFAFYDSVNDITQCSGTEAELNRWYHIAVSRDSSGTRRIFIDGILKNTQTGTPSPVNSSGILTIGRAGDYPWEYFKGFIDDVRISNTALYTADFSTPTSPLQATSATMALYHFDEGTGQTITDSSDNNRDGVLGSNSGNGGSDTGDPGWATDNPHPTPTNTPVPDGSGGNPNDGGNNDSGNNSGNNSSPSTGGGSSPDLNSNGKVDIFDLSILLRNWSKSGQGDINGNGKVDIFDLSTLIRSWSK